MHKKHERINLLSKQIKIFYNNNSKLSLSFIEKSWNLLSKPFATNCSNYEYAGGSRQACIDECLLDLASSKCKSIAEYLPISINDQRNYNLKITDYNDCTRNFKIREKCRNKCVRIDCFHDEYELFQLFDDETTDSDEMQTVILKIPSSKTNFYYDMRPQYTFIDLLIYVGNSISFWFGASIYYLLLLVTKQI